MAASENRSVSAAASAARGPRTAEKCHAIGLDEASGRERRGERQQRADGRHEKLKSP